MRSNLLAGIFIALGIVTGAWFLNQAIVKTRSFDRFVRVKGLAERTVTADQAIWHLSFNASNNDLKKLYQQITASQNSIKIFLLAQGFQPQEITLEPISVTDNQSYGYSKEATHQNRYVANANIVINTQSVNKVKQALQNTNSIVQQGIVLTSSYVEYFYNNLNQIKPGMLNEATDNARLAAQSFAKNAHNELGGIRSANQGLFTIQDATGQGDHNDIIKKVRVVTSVEYFIKS